MTFFSKASLAILLALSFFQKTTAVANTLPYEPHKVTVQGVVEQMNKKCTRIPTNTCTETLLVLDAPINTGNGSNLDTPYQNVKSLDFVVLTKSDIAGKTGTRLGYKKLGELRGKHVVVEGTLTVSVTEGSSPVRIVVETLKVK